MAFVATAGSIEQLSQHRVVRPSRIQLSTTYSADYAEIWRTQESVRTVISFLARNIAQLGLPLYERVGDADRQRLQDHPLAKMLRQPNPWTSRYRFISALVHDFSIYNNAYWLKTKFPNGQGGLVRIPPPIIKTSGTDWLTPGAFEVRGNRGVQIYPRDQIVYFRGFGVDADEGISPLEALRRTLREEFTAGEMREQTMRNGARMSGYLVRPKDAPEWSDTARDRFKRSWQAQYSGSGPGAGGTPILEDGMQFTPVSQTARDLQYVESRKLTREEVAAAYHIPPPMIGILDSATFSNITEQHKMLYQLTLAPLLVMIEEEIELQLMPDFEPEPGKFYVEFNLRDKLTGSFEERADSIMKAVGGPTMTINEARALDNRPPIDGGDELIRPLNVTQAGSQDPIPAAPAASDVTNVVKAFFDVLTKFNPNHDERGRFAETDGGASAATAALHTAATNALDDLGKKFPDTKVSLPGIPDQGVVQICGTLDEMFTKYPALKGSLTEVSVGDVDGLMALAETESDTDTLKSKITLDKEWMGDWKPGVVATELTPLAAVYQDAVDRGHFNPSGPNHYSAVLMHELGHVMDHMTESSTTQAIEDVYEAAWRKEGKEGGKGSFSDWVKSNTSGYSHRTSKLTGADGNPMDYTVLNPGEAVAEAFADVEMNGDKARPASKLAHDYLTRGFGAQS